MAAEKMTTTLTKHLEDAYTEAERVADQRLMEARAASRRSIMRTSKANAQSAIDAWQLWLDAEEMAEAAVDALEAINNQNTKEDKP